MHMDVPAGIYPNCGHTHTELRDFIRPYKHCESSVIQNVVNGKSTDNQHATPAARRFQKSYREALYQGDIQYEPSLPIGPNGKMQQTYLATWIDDATRFVVNAKFYANQTTDKF